MQSTGENGIRTKSRIRWAVQAGAFLRARFIAGVLILTPFVLTYILFLWLFHFGQSIFGPLFASWFGLDVRGLGFAVLILGPLLIGVLATHFLGRRLLLGVGAVVARIPVLGPVFVVVQQFSSAFTSTTEVGFNRVVEVEYPRKGLWTFGFLTDYIEHEDGRRMGVVYIPTAPAPNSGWLAIVPVDEIYNVDVSTNQLMRYILSAGVASPSAVRRTRSAPVQHPGPGTDQLGEDRESTSAAGQGRTSRARFS